MTFQQRRSVTLSPSPSAAFRRKRSPIGLWLFFAVYAALMPIYVRAEPPSTCYLIVVPGLQPEDLTRPELPALTAISHQAASGWMVCRTARIPSSAQPPSPRELLTGQLLSLGSGARAAGMPDTARLVERPRKGSSAPAFLASPTLQTIFGPPAQLDHPVPAGILGDLIHSAAGTTLLLTLPEDTDVRTAAMLLTMDSHGRTDIVRVLPPNTPSIFGSDALPSPSPLFPDKHRSANSEPDRLVVVLVDARIGNRPGQLPLDRSQDRSQQRAQALQRLNTLLTGLLTRLSAASAAVPQTPFHWLLLAPGPADAKSEREDRLAPIWMGGNDVLTGVLTSASTRRMGLVVNTDLLPTIAAFFHQPVPGNVAGRPFIVVPASETLPLQHLLARHDRLLRTARLQDALGGLPTVQLLLVLSGWLLLTFVRAPRPAIATGFAVLSLPLGMLLLPPIASASLSSAALLLGLFALAAGVAGYLCAGRQGGALKGVYGLGLALLLTLLGDLLTGKHLLEQAWMSYSVMEGARYYGIGNEYMGAAIGAACILPVGGYSLALLPLLTLAMGLGRFGAKVGAIPSAGVSFACLALVRLRGRLRWRDAASIPAAIGLILILFALMDSQTGGGQQTHFARALAGAGGDTLLGIAHRKLALEGYLLLHSPWSLTLLTCLACSWHLHHIRPSLFRFGDTAAERKRLASWAGLATGAGVGLLCNDSGVTAAAMILLYAWAWLLVQAAALPLPIPAITKTR